MMVNIEPLLRSLTEDQLRDLQTAIVRIKDEKFFRQRAPNFPKPVLDKNQSFLANVKIYRETNRIDSLVDAHRIVKAAWEVSQLTGDTTP